MIYNDFAGELQRNVCSIEYPSVYRKASINCTILNVCSQPPSDAPGIGVSSGSHVQPGRKSVASTELVHV